MKFLIYKANVCNLTCTTIQSLVYSYTYRRNSATCSKSVHQQTSCRWRNSAETCNSKETIVVYVRYAYVGLIA